MMVWFIGHDIKTYIKKVRDYVKNNGAMFHIQWGKTKYKRNLRTIRGKNKCHHRLTPTVNLETESATRNYSGGINLQS